MRNSERAKTNRRLSQGVAVIVLLIIGLCVTTFALIYGVVSVENNLVRTASVDINLNDGNPVIRENEFLFEPGMTVEKSFFIENNSTVDVYYKLYFENIEGALGDVLDVTLKSGDTVLYSGKASALTEANTQAADDTLNFLERRELKIIFHFPQDANNTPQNTRLNFDLSAKAVQTKNNPYRLFN